MVELITGIAWPAALLVSLYYFRDELKDILRSRSIKAGPVEVGPPLQHRPAESADPKSQPLLPTPEYADPNLKSYVQSVYEHFKTVWEARKTDEAGKNEEALLRYLADYACAVRLERVYREIFGSQLKALKSLLDKGGADRIENIKRFYDEAKAVYSDVYSSYLFDQWLAFLVNTELVRKSNDTIEITQGGAAMISYILLSNYPIQRAG